MGVSKKEIIELASRYISPEECIDFPCAGDLFCLFIRQLPNNAVLDEEEGWGFNGYGMCTGYSYDAEAKPMGKWLYMHFANLTAFPPVAQMLRLQPPHVVKGRFQSADRSNEIRIMKITFTPSLSKASSPTATDKKGASPSRRKRVSSLSNGNNIIAFRMKTNS